MSGRFFLISPFMSWFFWMQLCILKAEEEVKAMDMKKIGAFGSEFDITVERASAGKLKITVAEDGKHQTHTVTEGATTEIRLK